MKSLIVTGTTEAIIAGMFRDHDSHVIRWYRWKWAYERGLVDRNGIVLVGRRRGEML